MERAPRNLASNLWVVDRPFKLPYVGVEIGTRMTCIRLADGGLFLHSPVKLDPILRNSLDALGEVRVSCGNPVTRSGMQELSLSTNCDNYPIPSYAQWVPFPTSCTCYRRTLVRRSYPYSERFRSASRTHPPLGGRLRMR